MAVNTGGFSEVPGWQELAASPGTLHEVTEQPIINSVSSYFPDLPYKKILQIPLWMNSDFRGVRNHFPLFTVFPPNILTFNILY